MQNHKIMKTRIKYLTMIFAVFTLANIGCKDYLIEDNRVGSTEDVIYSTRSGIDGLVSSSYAYLRGWYGKEAAYGLSEGGTDTC